MEQISGANPPPVTPVPKQPVTGTNSARALSTPSLAQFAINQMVNKNKDAPLPEIKVSEGIVNNAPKPVGVFKDPDTGMFVTMLRNPTNGKIDQFPTEKALNLYAWVSRQSNPISQDDTVTVDIRT
jgi:hypothetical protein